MFAPLFTQMLEFVACFPWPETGIGAGVGFAVGFFAGGRCGHARDTRRSA